MKGIEVLWLLERLVWLGVAAVFQDSATAAEVTPPSAIKAPAEEALGFPVKQEPERGAPGSPRTSDPRCKMTNHDWNWFSDHVVASITYVVEASPERSYEIGTGPSLFGKPRGWKTSGSGKIVVSAWGVGAIHVRLKDGGPPTLVCVAQGNLSTISFQSNF